jgi:Trk-type K+ transport system membrane component
MRGRPIHIYNLNTKISLYTTLIIFAVTIVVFLFLEYNNSLAGFSLYDKISQAVFNATTPRSSGFVSVNPAGFLNVTIVFILFLMWIGGASQSTAGGIKVNTFAAILINLKAIILGRDKVTVFNRTIAVASVRRANAVVTLSIVSYLFFAMVLLYLEPALPTKELLFEACSALFTIGSSLGVTEMLGSASKLLLIFAMFIGRVGILSLLIGLTGNRSDKPVGYPTDNIIIN